MIYTRIILISLVVIVLFSYIRGCILTERLSKNYNIVGGYIYKVSPSGWKSSFPTFYYHYIVNGEKKYRHVDLNIYNEDTVAFIRKCFPVTYIPNKPDFGIILIKKDDFKKVGIPRPDSLKWVDDYIRKW